MFGQKLESNFFSGHPYHEKYDAWSFTVFEGLQSLGLLILWNFDAIMNKNSHS